MQYGEFLSSSLSPEAYRKILPSISDLVHKFHLDIEVALQVPTIYLWNILLAVSCYPQVFEHLELLS